MEIFKWIFSKDNKDVKKIERKESNDFKITESENEALCPYCKNSLIKFPSRKTKCPHCNNYIFVRKLNDYRLKTLVTQEQVKELEIEQRKNYSKE
jgi:Zn finger protein HypA/HybF involved in hydrogenase expression